MSSARKIAANRTNGRKSRGPRTLAGKARASRNAYQHGLTGLSGQNPAVAEQIVQIANAICNNDSNPLLFEQALLIAENEILLRHVSAERIVVIETPRDTAARSFAKNVEPEKIEAMPPQIRDEFDALREAMPNLARLHRYERRAWSRRKRAVREFIAIMTRGT